MLETSELIGLPALGRGLKGLPISLTRALVLRVGEGPACHWA